ANARAATIAVVSAFVLAACSSPSGYIDGWWDNGDPIYAPLKADLFDENGVAKCETPTSEGAFETRARSFTTTGGILNASLYEVISDEPDPIDVSACGGLTPAEEARERTRRERRLGSLAAMYQLPHPDFDSRNGVDAPDDMAPIKEDLRDHFPDLE